jgi:hypothetical protein
MYNVLRDLQRQAVIQNFQLNELLRVGLHQVRDFPDDLTALGRRALGPRTFERGPRCCNGQIDVLGSTFGAARNDLSRSGILNIKRAPAARRLPLAADQQLLAASQELAGSIGNIGCWQGCVHRRDLPSVAAMLMRVSGARVVVAAGDRGAGELVTLLCSHEHRQHSSVRSRQVFRVGRCAGGGWWRLRFVCGAFST